MFLITSDYDAITLQHYIDNNVNVFDDGCLSISQDIAQVEIYHF